MDTTTEAQQQLARLQHWIEQGGGSISNIHIVHLEGGERGLFAASDLATQQEILRIPRKYVISVEEARLSEIGRSIAPHFPSDYPYADLTYLAVFVMQERERGEASFWKPFLDSMPKAYPTHPFFYKEHELALLQGSFTLLRLESQRQQLTTLYEHLSQHVPAFAQYTFEKFLWAWFSVITRDFLGRYLVPFADMLNDNRPFNTRWGMTEDETFFEVRTTAPVAAGMEVHCTYGAKSNLSLLVYYGFVHEKNEYDTLGVFFGFPPGDPLAADKQRMLGLSEPGNQRLFMLTGLYDSKTMNELMAFMRVAYADAEELTMLTSDANPQARVKRPLSRSNEERALQGVVDTCKARLSDYTSSIEEDERLLQEQKLPLNVRNCVRVRLGEKRILQANIQAYSVLLS
jgi:histone-lysine N-methyltransferase SETD3